MELATGRRAVAERAGLCGVTGGMLWFTSGIVGMFFPQLNEPGTLGFTISGSLGTITLGLLLVGFLGIGWGGALGGRFGKAVFGVAVLGYALMVVGALQTVAGVGPLWGSAWGTRSSPTPCCPPLPVRSPRR